MIHEQGFCHLDAREPIRKIPLAPSSPRGQRWSPASADDEPAVPRVFSFPLRRANAQPGSRGRSYTADRGRLDGFGMTGLLRGPTLWVTERRLVRRLITEHRFGRQFALRFVAGDNLEAGMRA